MGHFPNVTHVQALVAHALSRQGKGWFEQRLGQDCTIDWYVYNAGPSAMEAIFAGAIDLTYVGPSPALNAFVRSEGAEVRIIAGAAEGGAALVVAQDSPIRTAADFRGKVLATPQLGNTQDVAARAWLAAGGLRITLTGGDAKVVPTANPDQLALFKNHQVDGVWTVEPWVSRLEREAGGRVLVEEKDAVTTVLVSSAAFLAKQAAVAKKFAAAHAELTKWVVAHPEEAQLLVRDELAAETKSAVAADLVAHAWTRIRLTDSVARPALEHFVDNATKAGFLKTKPDLARFVVTP